MTRSNLAISVALAIFTVASCQQLPTEPEPIDLTEELPVAVPDTVVTDEDVAVMIDVLANDSSLVGDELKVTGIKEEPTEGSAVIQSNKVRYTPGSNFSGIDSLRYIVSGSVVSADAPVLVVVRPVNDSPVARNDTFTVSETSPAPKALAILDVLANDSDIDGDRLTVLRTTSPSQGQVSIPEGALFLEYTPNTDFVGSDMFRYTIQDGNGGLDVADVFITVNASNDAPVAANDSYAVREDEQLVVGTPGVLANDTDEDLDPLTAVLRQGADHGEVVLNENGSFTYQPDADYAGTDAFSYIASDGQSESNQATVTLTVLPVNDRPVAQADIYTVNEDAQLNVTAPGVLANDLEPEGGSLSARLISSVTNGSLALSSNGGFTYQGLENFNGTDSFRYVASDGTVDSDPVTVTIQVNPVNDPPHVAVDAYELDEDTPLVVPAPGVLGNDTDVDSDVLTASLQSQPSRGTLTLQEDGSFLYTPELNFAGIDGFTYSASDGQASGVAAVSLTILPQNDAPVASADEYETPSNIRLSVSAPGILLNDTDAENDRLTVELVSEPTHGQAVVNVDGSFVYTPNASFKGLDGFTYRASDATLSSDPAAVRINVTAVGSPPVAADDFFDTSSDSVLVVAAPGVLENDSDGDQDVLTVVLEVDVTVGNLALASDGSFTYEPVENFGGVVTFTYRATDGSNVSNVAIVQLNVQ